MTNEEKRNKLLKEARERLIEKGLQEKTKKDLNSLLEFVRPEHMKTDKLKDECKKKFDEYVELSKDEKYDEYEREVIKNTASSFLEFMMKAYLVMIRGY